MVMTREQIVDTLKSLAQSQGFYGRLLQTLSEDCAANGIENVCDHPYICKLEEQGFSDAVDLVMYIEG